MGALKHKQLSQFDLTNQFTHLFFLGDLNYRIDLGATEIVEYAKKQEHHIIYTEDQLRKEREKKSVFVGFGRSWNFATHLNFYGRNRRHVASSQVSLSFH